MVKQPKKDQVSQSNITNNVLGENNPPPKSRQQINQENYQKNKEKLKVRQKINYAKKKEQAEIIAKQQSVKYYQAEAIKVLMSFKKYTELNKETRKLWQDFNWTLKDTSESINGIIDIMKLREVADNLIKDYWETAKKEVKKGKFWNSLDSDQQQKLIRYWAYEKVRIENNFIDTAEQLERQSQEYLKDIELAKFHEERGKKGCECWQCAESQAQQAEIKAKIKESEPKEKIKCPECGKLRVLDEEAGVCKSCVKKYE